LLLLLWWQPAAAAGAAHGPYCQQLGSKSSPAVPPAAAPGNFTFTSPSTGLTYIFSTFKKTWADAETFCQTQGGHLVAYSSSSQQREVEQAFVGDGNLLPYYHAAYHVGLTKTSTWNYTDYFFRRTSYLPWDKNQPTGAGTCGVANTRTQRNGIFMFNDASCTVERPFICLIHCKWGRAMPCCWTCQCGSSCHRRRCQRCHRCRNHEVVHDATLDAFDVCVCAHPTAPGTITVLNTNETLNGYDLPPGQMSVMAIGGSGFAQSAAFNDSLDAYDQPPSQKAVMAITTSSGVQFTFNNNNYTYDAAEIDCQMQGGHLPSYETMREQQDVESFLVDNVGCMWGVGGACCALHVRPGAWCKSFPGVRAGSCWWCTHAVCACLPHAGHPDWPVLLAQRLLDRPEGSAQVPQLHLGRPHRGAPGLNLQQLGRHPGRSQRADRLVQVRWCAQGRPQHSQPHQLRLGLHGLHAEDALRLQAGWR
jgi:hypothetical protein